MGQKFFFIRELIPDLGQKGSLMKSLLYDNAINARPQPFQKIVRIFIGQGAPMLKLLQLALRRGIETEYINKLLPAFDFPVDSGKSTAPAFHKTESLFQSADLIELLSERELEVLRYLKTHLTVVEISRALYVAPSTIHTHVRNIYSKLDVHNRIEAIQKANELKLI